MIRALHVINRLEPGGAETLVARLCERLPDEGVSPVVASLLGHGILSHRLAERGIPVVDLSREGRPNIFAVMTLMRIIRRRRIDIVHTHLVHAGVAGKLAAVFTGVPVVTTRHYTSAEKAGTAIYRLEDRLTHHCAERIVAVGEAVKQHLLAHRIGSPDRIVVHANAVDLSVYRRRAAGARRSTHPLVGTVGRMHPAKAHDVFLEAVAIIHRQRSDVRGVIVGDGQERPRLEALRSRLGLDGVVEFPGSAAPDAVPDFLAGFDVFVLSSDWEGVPMALIEAAASGLPIVATAVGGVPEIVKDGVTGILVQPRAPQALADAVLRFLDEPEMGQRCGEAARALAHAEFDISRLARQTAELYREVLCKRG